jgi:hypothetical protein
MASSSSTINTTKNTIENTTTNIPVTPVAPVNNNPPASLQNIPTASFSHFAQSVLKLNKTSFLVWRGLLEPFLQGHDLYGFIDGTKTPSHPYTSTSPDRSITISTDPETAQWFRQDQLILSMLMSTISEELLPQVLGCCTAQELWNAIERTFMSASRANTMTLHYQLATAKKGSSSIIDYFHRLKHTAATLAAAGQPFNDYEFTSFLLVGLGLEYDSLVTSITTRVEPLTMDDLLGHLLAHETRLDHHSQSDSLSYCKCRSP